MPRASLPSECVLRTMEVLLTKHTESDVKTHILSLKAKFYEIFNPIKSFLEKEIDYTYSNDVYGNLNWRKVYERKAENKPNPFKPRYEKPADIYPDLEQHLEKQQVLMNIKRDLRVCASVFQWEDEDFTSMCYEIERDGKAILELETELVEIDAKKFQQSKQDWDKHNQDWIDTFNLRLEHRKHTTLEAYERRLELELANPDASRFYGGEEGYRKRFPFADTSESCIHCIREREQRQQKQEQEEEQEQEQVQEQIVEVPQIVPVPVFQQKECKCCSFVANTQREWAFHIQSRDHAVKDKLSKTFCSVCSVQCKNEADYQVHLQTQKHKKKCGEIPAIHRCEPCKYETPCKRNFELHCATKKHLTTTEKNV